MAELLLANVTVIILLMTVAGRMRSTDRNARRLARVRVSVFVGAHSLTHWKARAAQRNFECIKCLQSRDTHRYPRAPH